MHDEAKLAQYKTRYSLLQVLSDAETAHVSVVENGELVPDGESYIDLEHPDRGVQRAGNGFLITSEVVITMSAVKQETWNKLLAALPKK